MRAAVLALVIAVTLVVAHSAAVHADQLTTGGPI